MNNPWGSRRIQNLAQSDIRAMTIECTRLGGINLGQGLCELPTPQSVVKAAQAALSDDRKNIYSQPEGILPLRQVIAKKLERENGIRRNPETEIVVTNGASGGYAATLMSLINPGEGILLFEPYYGYHLNAAILADIEPHIVDFPGESLELREADILKAIRPNTRAVVICTPNNPSGKMWSESELKLIAKIAKEKDLLVITDEMYEYFRYDNRPHISPASLPELADRTVTMMGLSKTFSITGWRLGYVAAPEPIAAKIRLANDLFYVCAPTPLQHGVIEGFNTDQSYFKELQEEFQTKRTQICEALEVAGLRPIVPQGAYYVLADIRKYGADDSKAFAMAFLKSTKVAAVPGRAFFNSKSGEHFVRFCFAVNDEALNTACKSIRDFKGGF